MALTRKMLKAMGIEDEKIDQIIEAHTESTDALKNERDGFKVEAEKLVSVQKELDDLKAQPGDDFKEKYENAKKALEDYRSEVELEKLNLEKKSLYKNLLREVGIDEKRFDAIIKVTDMDKVTLKDGKIEDSENVSEKLKEEWKDFIVSSSILGAKVDNPPKNDHAPKEPESLAEALLQKYGMN